MSSTELGLRDRLRMISNDILVSYEHREISLADPRFRWLLPRMRPENSDIRTLGELIDAVIDDTSHDADGALPVLLQLRDFVTDQAGLTLEQELWGVVAPLIKDASKVPGILARLGWHGEASATLQEAGAMLGVSRERVRQVQGQLEQELLRRRTWTPVLDRAVGIINRRLPLSEEQMGVLLQKHGITESAAFPAEGLLKATELLRQHQPFAIEVRRGKRWIIDPSQAGQLDYVNVTETQAVKWVNRYGIASIRALITSLRDEYPEVFADVQDEGVMEVLRNRASIALIDNAWLTILDPASRNPLVSRLNKILSVWNGAPLPWVLRQLGRDRRPQRILNADAVRALVSWRTEYAIDADERVWSREPLEPDEVLSDSEQALRLRILEEGGVATFASLAAAGEANGITRVTTAVTLKYSPIFFKLTRNEHRTIDPSIDPTEIRLDDLLEDDEESLGDIPEPETNEHVLPSDDEQGEEPAPPEDEPSPTRRQVHQLALTTVSDRDAGRIRKAIKSALRRQSIVPLTAIHAEHRHLYRETSLDAVREVVDATAEFIRFDDDLVTVAPGTDANPIAQLLRKMLLWVPQLPVDIALQQLHRSRSIGTGLTADRLRAYLAIDDEFSLARDTITWVMPLPINDVLDDIEIQLCNALRTEIQPMSLGAIRQRIGFQDADAEAFHEQLTTSVVIEEAGRHRYTLLAPDLRSALERAVIDEGAREPRKETGVEVKGDETTSATQAPTIEIGMVSTAPGPGIVRDIPSPDDDDAVEPDESQLPAVEERLQAVEDVQTMRPSSAGTMRTTMASIIDLVKETRENRLRLPEIQREYVWKPAQVVALLDSLYRHYPIGSMLIWDTDAAPVSRSIGPVTGNGSAGPISFLLDGQQRLTSLRRLLDDNTPDVRFNPFTEEFRIATATMMRQPAWLSVHDVFTRSASAALRESSLYLHPEIEEIERRVERLKGLLHQQIPVHALRGFDYEEVSDIFVRVNSQGTRLKTAELAVANLAFQLPGLISEQIATLRDELAEEGWDLPTLVMLRMLNAVATGQSRFSNLARVDRHTIERTWPGTATAIRAVLGMVRRHLGIESLSWLPTLNALVVPVAWRTMPDYDRIDETTVMEWFVRASVFGRYTGRTETHLNQDLRALHESRQPFAAMTAALRSTVGSFRITLADIEGATWQSPFALLYWVTLRKMKAVDLFTGASLQTSHLGSTQELIRHGVFDRSRAKAGLSAPMVNELANLVLLTEPPVTSRGAASLASLFPNVPTEWLQRQCIPTDPALWAPEMAKQFIETRRRILIREMATTLVEGL